MAASAPDPSAKREADALMASLGMAERHQRWAMMAELLAYIREADGKFAYLGPGSYALVFPPHPPKEIIP